MKRIAMTAAATLAVLVLLSACNDTGTTPSGDAPATSSSKADDGRGTNDETAKPGETK